MNRDASDCARYTETAVGTFKVKLPSSLFEVTTAKSLDPLADVLFVHSPSLRRRHTSERPFAQARDRSFSFLIHWFLVNPAHTGVELFIAMLTQGASVVANRALPRCHFRLQLERSHLPREQNEMPALHRRPYQPFRSVPSMFGAAFGDRTCFGGSFEQRKYALEPFTFVCSSTMSGAERRLR